MKELVLLTGASSGIGLEMAKILAQQRLDLILVARREDKLMALKNELEQAHGVKVHVFAKDLSRVENTAALYPEVKAAGLEVTMLVNNAGFGGYGAFEKTPLEQELEMITVNISSLVILTKLFLQDMKARNTGKIMNIGSILSFFPFPYYAVYAATKAFVLSFSESLEAELADTNITVVTLCPGPTDTPFNTPEMWKTNAYKANKPMPPTVIAKKAVEALLKGKGTIVVGVQNQLITSAPRFTPRRLMVKITKHLASYTS